MSKKARSFFEALQEKLKASERLSEDKSTTQHERDAATKKAADLRQKIKDFEAYYNETVEVGRVLAKAQGDAQWKLGDLAASLSTRYGDKTLKSFADDIDVNFNTLKGYRSTAVAWPEKGPRGPFRVCRELNSVPDRHKILKFSPQLNSREAAKIARTYRQKQKPKNEEASKGESAFAAASARVAESIRSNTPEWADLEMRMKSMGELANGVIDDLPHFEVTASRRKVVESNLKILKKAIGKMTEWKSGH
jgi:hypothetical protein